MVQSKITLAFTTGKRLNYFHETFNSLINNCLDFNILSDILIIDDGSSREDLFSMYSLLEVTNKPFDICINEKGGHANSIIKLYDSLIKNNTDFLFLCEDDWKFRIKDNWISKSLNILDDEHLQVILTCALEDSVFQPILNKDGFNFCEHIYNPNGRRQIDNWPGWSLNPNIQNFKRIYEKVGKYENIFEHEMNYSKKYFQTGLRIFRTVQKYALHIGYNSLYSINNSSR